MKIAPSSDQVAGQLRIIIPAIGMLVTGFGVSQTEAQSMTQALLASVGPLSLLITAVWSWIANSRTSIMKAASKPLDDNTPAPQIVLPVQEQELADKLPGNVTTAHLSPAPKP